MENLECQSERWETWLRNALGCLVYLLLSKAIGHGTLAEEGCIHGQLVLLDDGKSEQVVQQRQKAGKDNDNYS